MAVVYKYAVINKNNNEMGRKDQVNYREDTSCTIAKLK